MSSPNTNKSLYEVLNTWFDTYSSALNCIKIGEIVSFNKSDQTASIKILQKKEDKFVLGKKVLVDYPVIEKVPCVVMGGGSTYITHPISSGDQCVILFNDFMLDGWWASGEPRPSDFPRRHDISDAIAIVGLKALPNAIQNYSDYLNLHYSNNSSIVVGSTIEVNNNTINLNGTVTAQKLKDTSAASGSFRSSDNKTITVVNGIITSIVPDA